MSSAAPKTVQRTPFKRWCDENTGLFFLIPWILGFLILRLIRSPALWCTALLT